MSGRGVVHVAEVTPGPRLPHPLRVPREPVPAAAGGAVGHLENKQTSYIFPKAQVTANKNAHNFRHHFWAQFPMLFRMVSFILFGVLGRENFLID